jgi:hypothetical protein
MLRGLNLTKVNWPIESGNNGGSIGENKTPLEKPEPSHLT